MKTNSLFFIASLAVLASSASAASTQTDSEVVVLPTYVVTSPRYLPVEQRINASLKEFSAQALTPMVIATEMSTLQARSSQYKQLADAARAMHPVRFAKS